MYPDTHGSWMCIKQNKWSMDCLLYEGRVLDIADNSVSTAEGQSMEKRAIERNKSWAACQLVVLVKQTRRISLRKNHGHRKARSHSSRPSSSSAWKCDMFPPHRASGQQIIADQQGNFHSVKNTSPTRSHLNEELYLLKRCSFLENKHTMCLIQVCQQYHC